MPGDWAAPNPSVNNTGPLAQYYCYLTVKDWAAPNPLFNTLGPIILGVAQYYALLLLGLRPNNSAGDLHIICPRIGLRPIL